LSVRSRRVRSTPHARRPPRDLRRQERVRAQRLSAVARSPPSCASRTWVSRLIEYLGHVDIPSFFDSTGPAEKLFEVVRNDHDDRDLLESLWRRFAPYCGDPFASFLTDARTNLRGRVWEMALGCLLLDGGLRLRKPPSDGPDLCAIVDGRPIWIEATSVVHGTGPDAVRRIERFGVVDHDAMIRRYTSALEAKRKQQLAFVKRGVVQETDAFIIAINASAIDLASIERASSYPDIVRAVYPIGDPHFIVPVSLEAVPPPGLDLEVRREHPYRDEIPRVQSPTGIPARAFLDPRYEATSGVMFTASDPWNVRPIATMVVHNATARVPVGRQQLPAERDFWYEPTATGFVVNCDDRRVKEDD
jgi:hypothetical protein